MPQTRTYKKKDDELRKPGANSFGQLPPQDIELEEAVLGALMLERDAYTVVSDLLRPESFYNDQHRLIYQAIQSLASVDKPVDMLTVAEELKRQGKFQEAGSAIKLADLTNKVASTAHLRFHAQIVAQKATARDLISLASKISEEAYDETQDVEEMMNHAENGIFEISQRSMKRDVTQIDPVISEAIKRMEVASHNDGNISGIPSGFTEIDKITSGWQNSDLIIIAARPAMGKTAFVLSMIRNIAVNFHKPIAMFSLEMSNVQLVNRLIMNVCELDGEKIKNGRLSSSEWRQLEEHIPQLQGAPIYVDDTAGLSIFELRSKARKLKREKNISMIIIDYLQLMNAQGAGAGSREQEVSIISRNLKGLAKDLDIPIIALSQLNRNVEGRTGTDGKKPQLSDLRESGAIEQDADMVCFIHRPEYYRIYDDGHGHDMRGMAQIIIAKHRNGATGEVNLRFRANLAKFQNIDDNYTELPNETNLVEANDVPEYRTTQSKMNNAVDDGDMPF